MHLNLSKTLLCGILILGLAGGLFFLLPKPSLSSPQLPNHCAIKPKDSPTQNPMLIKRNLKDDNLIALPFYSLQSPLTTWEKTDHMSVQFEEAIRFPLILDSLHLAYPNPQDHPLFLEEGNEAMVAITISRDNCVSTEQWLAQIPYAKEYTKTYHIYNSKKWLIATRKNSLPLQTIAMLHDHGYHYEFTLVIKDPKTAEQFPDILDQLLTNMKPVTKK